MAAFKIWVLVAVGLVIVGSFVDSIEARRSRNSRRQQAQAYAYDNDDGVTESTLDQLTNAQKMLHKFGLKDRQSSHQLQKIIGKLKGGGKKPAPKPESEEEE